MTQTEGLDRLMRTLAYGDTQDRPYSDDAPIVDALPKLEYANLHEIGDGETVTRSMRAHIRYMAALWPNLPLAKVAARIHAVINNTNIDIDDIRMILQARSLSDPTRRTQEVPFEKIQLVGSCLGKGMSARSTAITVGLSLETVLNIDHFLGISDARYSTLVSEACDALRDGESVRKFADRVGEPKSTAHRIMIKAKSVLAELGEITDVEL